MLPFLLLMTFSPAICHGFLWPGRNNGVRTLSIAHTDAQDFNHDIESLTEQEIESLRLNYDALQSYSRKPDCFKRAAELIRTRCTELDMDEEARVNAAITMTLCEVATAKHHSLPLECRPYLHYDIIGKDHTSSKVQGECVDSLARSAQFWSSYSGYLREVPQLCHAFRRWNDIDLAKDIYRNATIEKIALIRFVLAREKMISKHTDKWTDMSSEMEQLVQQFKSLSEKYHSTADDFVLQLKDEADNALRSFRSRAHEILSRQEESNIQSTSQFQLDLSDIAQIHADGLAMRVDSFGALLVARLDTVLSLHEARYQQMDQVLLALEERWVTLGGSFEGMAETVFKLSDHTARLSQALETTVRGARNIHVLQAEASVAANDLVKTLNHLTETANAGLGQINGSVYLIGQHLEEYMPKASRTWLSWTVQMLGFILRAEPESFIYLERQLSFRLLLSALGLSWTAFRAIVSSMTTISMVLFLGTHKFFIQKSAAILSKLLHHAHTIKRSSTASISSSEDPELGSKFAEMTRNMGQTALDLDTREMPGNTLGQSLRSFGDDRYRRRVSRIPGRLWNAPAN